MYILVYITNVYCIIIPSNIRDPTIAEWMYIEQLIIYNNINIDIENIIILLGIRRYIILTMPGRIYKFTKESHTLRTVHLWIYIDASTVCRLRCSFFLCSLFIYQLIKINVFLLISGQFPTEKKEEEENAKTEINWKKSWYSFAHAMFFILSFIPFSLVGEFPANRRVHKQTHTWNCLPSQCRLRLVRWATSISRHKTQTLFNLFIQ